MTKIISRKQNSDILGINSEISSEQIDISSSVGTWCAYDVGFDMTKYNEIDIILAAKGLQVVYCKVNLKKERFFKTNTQNPIALYTDFLDPSDLKAIMCCYYSPTKIYFYTGASVVISRTETPVIEVKAYNKI